jgi:hypothetical protein
MRSAMTGLGADDLVEAAGYTDAPVDPTLHPTWVRIVRDGDVIAWGRASIDRGMGMLLFSGSECPGSGPGFQT